MRLAQPLNIFAGTVVIPAGKAMDVIGVAAKMLVPQLLQSCRPSGREVRPLKWKQFWPIVVTEAGMLIEVRAVQ